MKKLVASLLCCCLILVTCVNVSAFDDVSADTWYAEAVDYVSSKGLMTGVSRTSFGPNTTFSRAMLAQVLYRLNGSPEIVNKTYFLDVGSKSWYHDAVNWAYENDIMSGYSSSKFGPNDSLTREQLTTVLYRYDSLDNIQDLRTLDIYQDGSSVSNWARDSMSWAVCHDFVTGSNNKLLPKKSASRAEVAQILMRYLEYVSDEIVDTVDTESYIDIKDGVIYVTYIGDVDKIRFRLSKDDESTLYVLEPGRRYMFTFPYGEGTYACVLYENTTGTKYRRVLEKDYYLSQEESGLSLTQMSHYYDVTSGVKFLVDSIWDDELTQYENVKNCYDWIVSEVEYDYDRMYSVESGYLPDLELAVYNKRAVCLDYASLISTMCRYKGVPAQIVVGYQGDICHAWSRVYLDNRWILIDPTFGASLYKTKDQYFDMSDSISSKYRQDYLF